MLALDDAALARFFIAATKFARDADRIALLEDFARRAGAVPRSGLSGAPNRAPGRRPRAVALSGRA